MITVLGGALLVTAVVVAVTGLPLLLAAGLAACAVGIFALGPTAIGRPAGDQRQEVDATPSELKRWREAHPGSTIGEAIAARSRE